MEQAPEMQVGDAKAQPRDQRLSKVQERSGAVTEQEKNQKRFLNLSNSGEGGGRLCQQWSKTRNVVNLEGTENPPVAAKKMAALK